MHGLSTGELAQRSGVNLETVRYYERRGLLPKAPRSVSGYRAFPFETVRRVRFIKRAQALGFSLKEIRDLLGLRGGGKKDVRRRAEVKMTDIEAKIRSLRRMQQALRKLLAACDGESSDERCPILAALDEDDEL